LPVLRDGAIDQLKLEIDLADAAPLVLTRIAIVP